jgi:hypothetical protein
MTNLRQQPAHNPCRAVWHNVLGDGSSPLSTTQSRATGDFLKVNERPRIGGDLCDGSLKYPDLCLQLSHQIIRFGSPVLETARAIHALA